MRDKLIELVIDAKRSDPETGSFTEYLADHLIANGVTIQQWIPVSERSPELRCLIVDARGSHVRIPKGIAEITDINGTWCMDAQLLDLVDKYGFLHYGNRITHWMPLPMPPQEEVVGKCDCFHMENGKAVCWGTKEKDACGCGGDKRKCSFYPPQEEVVGKCDCFHTADVVEVVRCKDCKYWDCYGGEDSHKGDCMELIGLESCMYENDFCSYGERRKDG